MTQPANRENSHLPGEFVANIPSGTEITSEMAQEMYDRAIRAQVADEAEQPTPEFRSSRCKGRMLRGTIISNPAELIRDHRNDRLAPQDVFAGWKPSAAAEAMRDISTIRTLKDQLAEANAALKVAAEAKHRDDEVIRALTNALDDARARSDELMQRIESLEMASLGVDPTGLEEGPTVRFDGYDDPVDWDRLALQEHLDGLIEAGIWRRRMHKPVPVHDFAPPPDMQPGDMFAMHPSEHEPPDFVPQRVARWAYLAIGGAIMAAALLSAQFLTS
jgi:hypothetical protein